MKKIFALAFLTLAIQIYAQEVTLCGALCKQEQQTCRIKVVNQTEIDRRLQYATKQTTAERQSREVDEKLRNDTINQYRNDQNQKCFSLFIACKEQCIDVKK